MSQAGPGPGQVRRICAERRGGRGVHGGVSENHGEPGAHLLHQGPGPPGLAIY